MNTQNTPVHIRLWHHDFWRLAIANLLLSMAVTIFIPTLPLWLLRSQSMSAPQAGLAMAVFGLGLFLFGGFTSFLVQHYRRNQVFVWAALGMVASLVSLYLLDRGFPLVDGYYLVLAQRLLFGAFFGLAQMVLSSTLIIDTSESYQRTEANHAASWFARFSLSLGPLAGLLLYPRFGFESVLLTASVCVVAAVILVLLAHFPFRAPDDHVQLVSLDRFLLPHGWLLFINLLMVTTVGGLLLSLPLGIQFYSMMMVGFLLAIVAQRFVFREAELKSEVVSALLLMLAALMMLLTRSQSVVGYVSPLFVGFSLGIIGSRFLLFFIKLSRHCQRGTSQSTYLLGWESGLALGLGLGYALFRSDARPVMLTALGLSVTSLLLYQFTHRWFLKHKNR